jgi:hypothetical protein
MTYALSLILWATITQTSTQPAPMPTDAPVAVPATVVVQYAPGDTERALRTQIDEARDQLAKVKEESGRADNALAALLLSDHPETVGLPRRGLRHVRYGPREIQIDVYGSMRKDEPMVAVIVNLKNPRGEKTWEPTEAWVMAPYNPNTFARHGLPIPWYPPMPAAVRSAPQRILPGQSARIAVVFDKTDLESADEPVRIGLQRDGELELEFELALSDVQPTREGRGIGP